MSDGALEASVVIGPIVVCCHGPAEAVAWLWPQHDGFSAQAPAQLTVSLSISDTPFHGPPTPMVERCDGRIRLSYHGWRAELQGNSIVASIFGGPESKRRGPRRLASLLRVAVQTFLGAECLALHGATLAHDGRALVFIGHRGAGKTTLSTRYTVSPRLGDDYALVARGRSGFVVHGTPYSGREGTPSEAGYLPLAAIVVLRKERPLNVSRLSATAAFPSVLEHVIAADMTRTGLDERLAALERVVHEVPVLCLESRKDDAIWAPLDAALVAT